MLISGLKRMLRLGRVVIPGLQRLEAVEQELEAYLANAGSGGGWLT